MCRHRQQLCLPQAGSFQQRHSWPCCLPRHQTCRTLRLASSVPCPALVPHAQLGCKSQGGWPWLLGGRGCQRLPMAAAEAPHGRSAQRGGRP